MRKPIDGFVSAPFSDGRPFGSATPDHVHGAIDIRAAVGSVIFAPERGKLRAYLAIRHKDKTYWPDQLDFNGLVFPYRNYFYDMFGGILVLRSLDGNRTHVISHCYGNQLFNAGPFETADLHWVEEATDTRWPIHAVYTDEVDVSDGEGIGRSGSSGLSSGPHIHWEIHHQYRLNDHADRIDPEVWVKGEL